MKSITIHGINADLDRKIQKKSKELGLSQNKTIKKLLEDSLSDGNKNKRIEEFRDLFGTWTEEDVEEFERAAADLERIDEEDWK